MVVVVVAEGDAASWSVVVAVVVIVVRAGSSCDVDGATRSGTVGDVRGFNGCVVGSLAVAGCGGVAVRCGRCGRAAVAVAAGSSGGAG